MALRAKVRGQWRTVSKAMARRFRAKGLPVEDTEKKVAPSAPPAPSPPQPAARPQIWGCATVRTPVLALPEKQTADLTDEELEKLTKPES